MNRIAPFGQEVANTPNTLNSADAAIRLNELKAKYEDILGRKHFVTRDTPEGLLIAELANQNIDAALGAASQICRIDTSQNRHDVAYPPSAFISGEAKASMFLAGLFDGDTNVSRTQLSRLVEEGIREIDRLREALVIAKQRRRRQTRIMLNVARMRRDEWDRVAGELESKGRSRMGQLLREGLSLRETYRQRLEDLEAVYEKKLSLEAPVQYWNRKKVLHIRAASIFGFFFLVGLGGLGWWLAREAHLLLAPDAGVPPVWKIVRSSLFVFLGVWLLHLLAKLTLSMVHLVADAGERKTMTMTYLALLREGAVVDAEREIVLRSLFRPTTTGIFKDAGGPPLIQMVSSIKKDS